jgi:hypothetical protein
MVMNDSLEEKYKQDIMNIEKVEESLDFMRQDAFRKTDMMIEELLYYTRNQSSNELYPIIHQMNANVEEFNLYLINRIHRLQDEKEEITAKYRKELEQLEEERRKQKREENF